MSSDKRSPLDVLAHGGQVGRWAAPDQLKRLARRRRQTRVGVFGAGALAVATAISLAVALPGGGGSRTPVAEQPSNGARIGAAVQLVANVKPAAPATGSPDERAVAAAEQQFALDLLKEVDSGASGNVMLSPSSLAIALAMLQNGAAGKTRAQIASVLHTSGLTDAQLDAGWAALSADLASSGVLDSANSLWLQHGTPMGKAFMDAMARYFRTGVWQVDFADLAGASRAINAWVGKQTRGKITKLFGPGDIDASTVLVLANAVYFKAAWQTAFDPKKTRDAPFHLADGTTVSVPFMHSSEDAPVKVTNTRQLLAVQLPYAGRRFAALAVMPRTQSLGAFVQGLTPQTLDQITAALGTGYEPISLPKFTISQYNRLNGTLKAMGMSTAFGPKADLRPMSSLADSVQSVVQRAYLKVDEHGTEAAAVSGIAGASAGTVLSPTLDRPFLFLIRDTKTGAIVFSAQIQNPAP